MYTLLVKASQFGSLVLFSFKKTEGKTRPGDTQGDAQVPNHQQGFAVLSHMPHILASAHLELSHREGISVTEIFDLRVPGIIKMTEPWLRKRISLKQIKVNGDCG